MWRVTLFLYLTLFQGSANLYSVQIDAIGETTDRLFFWKGMNCARPENVLSFTSDTRSFAQPAHSHQVVGTFIVSTSETHVYMSCLCALSSTHFQRLRFDFPLSPSTANRTIALPSYSIEYPDTGEKATLSFQYHYNKEIVLTAPSRGFHLVTDEIYRQIPEISQFKIGLAHLFIKHTSASLSVNENCDPDVRSDLEGAFQRIVPESWNRDLFKHTMEGDDDMPAHVKSTIIGASIQIPITNGRLNLGTWQGIYLCEHRDTGGWGGGHKRKIVVTLQGSG